MKDKSDHYRRCLFLIDAMCLASGRDGDELIGRIYRLAHTATGLCTGYACQNSAALADEIESGLVENNVCSSWKKTKRMEENR